MSEMLETAERLPEIGSKFGWFWHCPFCKDNGFDLKGLAHHVWLSCDVVKHLAQENIEDCRRSHENLVAALRARANQLT